MNSRIIIVGANTQAKSLAESLLRNKYDVTIICNNFNYCNNLSAIDNLKVIYGDGSSPYILQEANADMADTIIALCEHDADNLVICEIGKKLFNIKKAISLVNDEKKTNFFYSKAIDSVVCASSTINAILEQSALTNELATVIPIGEGRVRINEVLVTKTSPIVNKKLIEITMPKESIIGCVLRGEQSIIPRGNTIILENDLLLLISSDNDTQDAISVITGR